MGKDLVNEYRKERKRQDVLAQLKKLSDAGMIITVEGYPLSLEETAKVLTVSEGVCYMPDYLNDEQGRQEVRFNRVQLTDGN